MEIKNVVGRYILDSRGNPTVEADVWLTDGSFGRASVPSGASTGIHEAVELRDGGDAYDGKGVLKAVDAINNSINHALVGIRADDQFKIDSVMRELDGTEDKSSLGANALLAVSLANAKAAAASRGVPFWQQVSDIAGSTPAIPMPMVNILNGGVHAVGGPSVQEFMIVPTGSSSIQEALEWSSEIFHKLGKVLSANKHITTVGDEGGYAPRLHSTKDALDYIMSAIAETGHKPLQDICVALDIASSELLRGDTYHLESENLEVSGDELIDYYIRLCQTYPIISIEDGLAQDDWTHWSSMTKVLSQYIMLVTDDLTVSNKNRLQKAIDSGAGNTILIKPNQIGTLTETIETYQMAKAAGWKTILSHRSGDTEDAGLAHIAVGLGADYIKAGSMSRSERLAKYNELLRISEAVKEHSSAYARKSNEPAAQ